MTPDFLFHPVFDTKSRLDLPEYDASPLAFSTYPNIDEFTEHGQIVIGYMEPVGAVAIAAEGRQTLAMLRRRKEETFRQLLARLDLARASTFTNPKGRSAIFIFWKIAVKMIAYEFPVARISCRGHRLDLLRDTISVRHLQGRSKALSPLLQTTHSMHCISTEVHCEMLEKRLQYSSSSKTV